MALCCALGEESIVYKSKLLREAAKGFERASSQAEPFGVMGFRRPRQQSGDL